MREALLVGEVPRGKAAEFTGYQERRGRATLSPLLDKGLLVAQGPGAPVCFGFPTEIIERWFPQHYPILIPPNPRWLIQPLLLVRA